MLKETDTAAVAYCPVASMWKGNAVALVDFFAQGIRVGLGSDATRNDGRMLDAAEAAQRIAYGMARDDFSCAPAGAGSMPRPSAGRAWRCSTARSAASHRG